MNLMPFFPRRTPGPLWRKLLLIAFALLLVHSQPVANPSRGWAEPPSQIRNGPYLAYPGNNTEMSVIWRLRNPSICRLEWGATKDTMSASADVSPDADNRYTYRISHLTPGKTYYYRMTENEHLHTGSFIAAPPENQTQLAFYAMGDTRSDPSSENDVLGEMLNEIQADPSSQTFVLHSGDWNNDCGADQWDSQFFNPMDNILSAQSRLAFMGTWGNHDCVSDLQDYFPWPYADTNHAYYSFNYGPLHVISLDQSISYSSGSAQYQWLENDLRSSDKLWKIILLHKPGYSAGGHGNEADVQDHIQPLCERYDVQVVIGGHNHYYAHCIQNKVHHLTVGGGGAPLYDPNGSCSEAERTYHFAKFNIEVVGQESKMVVDVIRPDGSLVEIFELTRAVPAPPTVIVQADFDYSATYLSVDFTDTSQSQGSDIVDWAWEFGDGASATVANPQHVYAREGQYNVRLTVTAANGESDTATRLLAVSDNIETVLKADFEYTADQLMVQFTDDSQCNSGTLVRWLWDFGDGSTAEGRQPIHTYAGAGNYQVRLTVINDAGVSASVSQEMAVANNEPPGPNPLPAAASGSGGGGGGGCFISTVAGKVK